MEDVDKITNPMPKYCRRNSSIFVIIFWSLDQRLECEIPSTLLSPFLLIKFLIDLLDLKNIFINLELENLILENTIYLGYINLFLLFFHYLQPAHH